MVTNNAAQKATDAFRARVIQDAIAALNNARHSQILHQTKASGKLHGLTNRQQREVVRKAATAKAELEANIKQQQFFSQTKHGS